MDTPSIDREQARTLGRAVATHGHESLSADQVDAVATLTDDIASALEMDAVETATMGLLEFWTGHVAGEMGVEIANPETADIGQLFEDGFQSGALGVDLYQALSKVETAQNSDARTADLAAWTERLFELTNRHVAHLKSHQ